MKALLLTKMMTLFMINPVFPNNNNNKNVVSYIFSILYFSTFIVGQTTMTKTHETMSKNKSGLRDEMVESKEYINIILKQTPVDKVSSTETMSQTPITTISIGIMPPTSSPSVAVTIRLNTSDSTTNNVSTPSPCRCS